MNDDTVCSHIMSGFYLLIFATLGIDALLLILLISAFSSPRFARYRIAPGEGMKVSRRARIRNVTVSSSLSLVVVLGSTYLFYGSLFYERSAAPLVKIAEALEILVVYDFAYYGLHRAMHIKKVMRFVHGVHHRAKSPSALESFYLHPAELLSGLALLIGSTRIVGPVHTQAFAAAFFVYSTSNIFIHSGLDFSGPRFGHWILWPVNYLTRKHHVHHHDDFSKNFSSLTPLPDILFGTRG